MTLDKFLLAALGCVALAACAPATKDAATEVACGTAGYQSLVGSNVAAISLPADINHRIYKDGDPVTMDYSAERLNIVTDENGVVIEVKCG